MKITFIIAGSFDVRGGVKRIFEYATRLARRGHQVDIMAEQADQPAWLPTSIYNGFNIVSFRDYSVHKTDVAIATGGKGGRRLARMKNAKVKVYSVVMQESLNKPTEKHGRDIDRDKFLSDCYQQKWLYIANSSWLKDLVETQFGQKCHLIKNGVNSDILHPVDVPKTAPLSVLCYGRSEGWKGGQRSARAAELASKEIPGIKIVSYGQSKGPITWLPLTHYRVPDQKNLAKVYCSADIFLQSSRFEGFCNTGFEAMACGVPVISTKIVGIEDFCIDEETALLVPVDDPQAMADAIVRLHRDKDLYNKLRTNGLEMIKNFQWDNEMAKLESILQEALHATPALA